MARFFWQPDTADIGGPPSDLGIVQPWDPLGVFTVVDETAQTVFKVPGVAATLEITHPTSGALRRLAAFVSIGGIPLPETADAEIWMHFVANGAVNETRNALRADLSTSTATATLLTGGLRRAEGQSENARYLNGAFLELGTGPGGPQNIYKQRVRAEGSTLFTKVWRAADPEPAGWTITTPNVDVTGPGAVGWFQSNTDTVWRPRIVAIGIGTGGDSAPDAPIPSASTAAAAIATVVAAMVSTASGRLRHNATIAGSGIAAISAGIAGQRFAGPLVGRLPGPKANASGATGGMSALAAVIAGPAASAVGRLRAFGTVAGSIPPSGLMATARAGALPAPTPGRTLRPAPGDRRIEIETGRHLLVPDLPAASAVIFPEETDNG